jgi:hypothetical protein
MPFRNRLDKFLEKVLPSVPSKEATLESRVKAQL